MLHSGLHFELVSTWRGAFRTQTYKTGICTGWRTSTGLLVNPNKITNLIALSPEERYLYFVRKVADFEEVWGLFSEGWAMVEVDSQQAIPFWPERVLADLCCTSSRANYQVRRIALDAFMNKWLPGMKNDGLAVVVFPLTDGKGIAIAPDDLLSALEQERAQY